MFYEIEEKIAKIIPQELTIILQSTLLFLCEAKLSVAYETLVPQRKKDIDPVGKVLEKETLNLMERDQIPYKAILCEYHLIRLRQILTTTDDETFIGKSFISIT